MSNIVPVEGGLSLEELAVELGASSAPKGPKIPALKINSQGEDRDGNQIPLGAFFLNTGEDHVYAKDGVKIRPLSNHIQYMHWGDGVLINKSRLVKNMREEARDQLGGMMVGMPTYEQSVSMSKEEREEYIGRDRYRIVRALCSYTGKTASGEERTVENQPCILSLKRKNYGPFYHDVLNRLPADTNMFDFDCVLTAEKNKTDKGAVYYVMRFSPQFSTKLPLDQMTYDSLSAVSAMVKAENLRIDEKHFEAMDRKNDEVEQDRIMDEVNTLDGDFK